MLDGDTETRAYALGVGAATVAVTAWGLSGVVAKDIDMPGIAIGAYRFTMYGLVVAAAMALRGKLLSWRVLRESMWGGLALGADVALFFSAVKLTSVANATVIGALQPVVVGAVAARLFGERFGRRDLGLGAIAIAGVAVMVLAGQDLASSDATGDLLAVGAVFAWATYFIFSKRAQDRITSAEYSMGAALWCGLSNIPLALLFDQSLAWPSRESWVGLLILAFGAGVLGHNLMNWSIQQIPLWISSILTLLIPVVSATAAWIYLDESLLLVQIVAMSVVLIALAGIVARQPPRPSTPAGASSAVESDLLQAVESPDGSSEQNGT